MPEVGDLVALPSWLPDCPYRVLGVRGDPGAGWVWLDGYLVRPGGSIRVERYRVPVAGLRRLPDPVWGG